MSSSPSFCGICDIRHISKPSDVWCPDCDEGLCTECLDHHSLVKSSRKHTTIPIAEYQKDGELDMMLISCNILIVLTCKLTLINGHQSFKMYLHIQFPLCLTQCAKNVLVEGH